MPTLTLPPTEARIAYLATAYHLGRPGSETDAATLQPHGLGLAAVHAALAPHIEGGTQAAAERAAIEVQLSAYQLDRLGEALLGLVNELKQYGLAQGRSAVPGFDDAMRHAFPAVRRAAAPAAPAADPAEADEGDVLDLVTEVMALHRRLAPTIEAARAELARAREAPAESAQAGRRRWWQRWQR